MIRRLLGLALAVVACPALCDAQIHREPDRRAGAQHWEPLFGLHVGAPQRGSVVLGLARARDGKNGFTGLGVVVEPGLGGGRVAFTSINAGPTATAQARLAVLRTWRKPSVVAPRQTFAGAELRVTLYYVTGGAGYYWRLRGGAAGDARFAAYTVGVGF